MRILNKEAAAELLRSQGITSRAELEMIVDAYDFDKPVYEHDFWPGDVLYQLRRLQSFHAPLSPTGNWFGLAGVTSHGVAINDGLSGREAIEFEVIAHFRALEGTARALPQNLGTGIGGPGGQTQVFLPRPLLFRLEAKGGVNRW